MQRTSPKLEEFDAKVVANYRDDAFEMLEKDPSLCAQILSATGQEALNRGYAILNCSYNMHFKNHTLSALGTYYLSKVNNIAFLNALLGHVSTKLRKFQDCPRATMIIKEINKVIRKLQEHKSREKRPAAADAAQEPKQKRIASTEVPPLNSSSTASLNSNTSDNFAGSSIPGSPFSIFYDTEKSDPLLEQLPDVSLFAAPRADQ